MQDTKKVAGELLVELEKKGVTFETVDGKLKYKDSKGNFTENSKEKVKKYKEEIIEILKKKQTIDEFITDNDYETNVYPLTDVYKRQVLWISASYLSIRLSAKSKDIY